MSVDERPNADDILNAIAVVADLAADDERATALLERLWAEAIARDLGAAYVAGYVGRGIVQALGAAA